MKQNILIRGSRRETILSLPMSEVDLKQFLEKVGEEYIIIDSNCVFPIGEYENIPHLNETVKRLAEVMESNSMTEEQLKVLFKASTLSVKETVESICNSNFDIIGLELVTSGWLGSPEEKAAMYLNQNFYPTEPLAETFKESDGVAPDSITDYLDWEAIWGDYYLNFGWNIVTCGCAEYLVNIRE